MDYLGCPDTGMTDMMVDAHLGMEVAEEDPEETAQAYYAMLEAAKQPLHENTTMSQLDAISRLIALKSSLGISRDGFDLVLATGQLLPKGHSLPKNMYESQKLLRALKMPYEAIHACKNGCVLFRGDHETATHCPKCKASRYVEIECSDGSKKQSKILELVIRHLPATSRIQRLYMTEESAKRMTWHKKGKRYSDKMQHPADGDAWKHFDEMNPKKAAEAQNVRGSDGNRWVQPVWNDGVPVHLLARVRDPPQSPPRRHVRTQECVLDTDNTWTPGQQYGCVHATSVG
jgi:hypothetical protein